MEDNVLKSILKKETDEEKHILKSLEVKNAKELSNEIIMEILHPILGWEIIDKSVVLKSEHIFFVDDDIMISKHHRYIDIPSHKHDFIEMIYVYSGSCTQILNGNKITLEEGEMIILDMNIEHSIYAADENDIIINCIMRKEYFNTSFFSRISSNDLITSFLIRAIYEDKTYYNYCIFKSKGNMKLKRLVQELTKEYYNKSICSKEIINCYIILIFSELLEAYRRQKNEAKIIDNKINLNNISDILTYIQRNYETVTLREVANKFHFHPNYLSCLIKKITGLSFKNIIHEEKLKKAIILLKNTDMNIEDISIEAGYSNQTFFYKKFKERFNMTPQQYRNLNKLKNI